METFDFDTIGGDTASTVLSVSELTARIKSKLESGFVHVEVQGEISNFKPNSSGHLYFDLKDSGAKIPAVFFRAKANALARLPKEGDQVTLKGSLSVYAPHGRYQLIVTQMRFEGIGELLYKLEELKQKLKAKGYFDPKRKKPLPKFPAHIGVVTSPTGAVIRDIIHILTRRARGFHLRLIPVRVQGPGAAEEIATAIAEFNTHQLADVIIVGRGGGSLEDLWAFNEPVVVEAIFQSKIPIISAVGHETDTTLADFVADLRAPTPSAAAEIVATEQQQHLTALSKHALSLARTLHLSVAKEKARLQRFSSHPLLKDPLRLFTLQLQKIDLFESECDRTIKTLFERLNSSLNLRKKAHTLLRPDTRLALFMEKLLGFSQKLNSLIHHQLHRHQLALNRQRDLLDSLNPKEVLKRGFTILFEQKGGSAIVSRNSLRPEQKVLALFHDGQADLVVAPDLVVEVEENHP